MLAFKSTLLNQDMRPLLRGCLLRSCQLEHEGRRSRSTVPPTLTPWPRAIVMPLDSAAIARKFIASAANISFSKPKSIKSGEHCIHASPVPRHGIESRTRSRHPRPKCSTEHRKTSQTSVFEAVLNKKQQHSPHERLWQNAGSRNIMPVILLSPGPIYTSTDSQGTSQGHASSA